MNNTLAVYIVAVVGIIIQFITAYLPGVADWYGKQTPTNRGLIQVGLLFVAALATFGLSCAGLDVQTSCDTPGALLLLKGFFVALLANQMTYLTYIKPRKKEAAYARNAPPPIG